MDINAISGNIYAYPLTESGGAAANTSPPSRVEPLIGPSSDFAQPANESHARSSREPRSIWGEIWDRTPFGVIQNLIEGKQKPICSVFPGVCSIQESIEGPDVTRPGNEEKKPKLASDEISINDFSRGVSGGAYIQLSQDPYMQKRIMEIMDRGIKAVKKAIDDLKERHQWNSETLTSMRQLFGDEITTDEGLSKLESRLERVLGAMEKNRKNNGKDIYLELVHDHQTNNIAYAPRDDVGFTGQLVLSRGALDKTDDASLIKTLIHEHAHLGAGLIDHWYLDHDKDRGFSIRPREDGSVPAFNARDALDNPDCLAYGALALAKNPVATVINPLDYGDDDGKPSRYEF